MILENIGGKLNELWEILRLESQESFRLPNTPQPIAIAFPWIPIDFDKSV